MADCACKLVARLYLLALVDLATREAAIQYYNTSYNNLHLKTKPCVGVILFLLLFAHRLMIKWMDV
jgi:hypothetical protein